MSHANYIAKNPYLYRDTLLLLQRTFGTDLFNFKKPLAIGIHRQVKLWSSVKSRDLHICMRRYTQSTAYLRLLKVGAARYNILGEIVGYVTEDEAEIARKELYSRGQW